MSLPVGGWSPFVLAVAPNGARKTKADHPALPMSADEIARDAAEGCELSDRRPRGQKVAEEEPRKAGHRVGPEAVRH